MRSKNRKCCACVNKFEIYMDNQPENLSMWFFTPQSVTFLYSGLFDASCIRPLQVVIRFLVRASPKSRGGWAESLCHYST